MSTTELPVATNVTIFFIFFIIATITAIYLVSFFASNDAPLLVRVTTTLSYLLSFFLVYFTSLDVTGGYQEQLRSVWLVFYLTISVCCWIIVPFMLDYHDNGGFTWKDKAKNIARMELLFYIPIAIVGGIVVLYLIIRHHFAMQELISLLLNLANTIGFMILTFFFGYGLIDLPLSIWRKGNRVANLQFCLYKLGKMNEKMAVEVDRLSQTNDYIQKLSTECPHQFQSLLSILREKLPDSSTAYNFAFLSGKTNQVEAFSELEKIQKVPFAKLKYNHFKDLHYIIINHRRSLAMFNADWKETFCTYIFLNKVLTLQNNSTFQDIQPSALIEPGSYTYTNFPGSFLWQLPVCCGERVDHIQFHIDSNTEPSTTNSIDQQLGTMHRSPMLSDNPRDESSLNDNLFLNISNDNSNNRNAGTDGINIDLLSPDPRTTDLYDDMSGLQSAPSATQLIDGNIDSDSSSTNNRILAMRFKLTSWLFRKQPDLIPGTIYHRLTWWWFKYLIFFQPFFYKILGVATFLMSLLMLYCEFAILLPRKYSPLYHLAHIEGATITAQTFTRILPLLYIVVTTYHTIFSINLGFFFRMQKPRKTTVASLLFSASLMLRMVFTMIYNFYQMAGVTDTAFTNFIGKMEVIELLGKNFNRVFPLLVLLFSVLTLINFWSVCLRFLGVPHFNYNTVKDSHSAAYISDGRILVDNEIRRQNGERIAHFRGSDVEIERRRQQRQASSSTSQSTVPKNESEHARKLKEKYNYNGRGSTATTTTYTPPDQSSNISSIKAKYAKKGPTVDEW